MKSFNERDVRRHYDLLQHVPESGLTHLKAMDGIHIFGVGLFDNEDDFVSECERYNKLGTLYVGVNPRDPDLLDQYGGLHNRMRSLFRDVVESVHVSRVTGIAVPAGQALAPEAKEFSRAATRFSNGDLFFALDSPLEIPEGAYDQLESSIGRWLYGDDSTLVPLIQFTPVMGTSLTHGSWFRRRYRFRHYRPYVLEGIHTAIGAALEASDQDTADDPT